MLGGQLGQCLVGRGARVLHLEGLLVVVLRCAAGAADERPVRARHDHEAAVGVVVLGQGDRHGNGPHARQAVLGVPCLEVRVPVEAGGAEARLDVDPGLVDVHVGAEDAAGGACHAFVAYQVGEDIADLVDFEHRPDLLCLRFDDPAFIGAERRVVDQPVEFGAVGIGLVVGEQVTVGQEAVAFVRLQAGGGRPPDDRVPAACDDLGGATGRVEVLDGRGGRGHGRSPSVRGQASGSGAGRNRSRRGPPSL